MGKVLADHQCPVCHSDNNKEIYSLHETPVHSVRLYEQAEQALTAVRGEISLHYCSRCTMVWNAAFDPDAMQYDDQYEETQSYSETFNRFHQELTEQLFTTYEMKDRRVIEIGCGKGEFLSLLHELGIAYGLGFDPSFDPERTRKNPRLKFRREFFPPQHSPEKADFYCCKMTLEHISRPGEFIKNLRTYIDDDSQATIFFQVPSVERILSEIAYWDIYYEHCNYFSASSLRYLFEANRFEVLKVETLYQDQYLSLVARPTDKTSISEIESLGNQIDLFCKGVREQINAWEKTLLPAAEQENLLIWGAASKAVGLISAINELASGCRLVDINPHKHHTYLPGTNLRIQPPEEIRGQHFDLILIANPVYEAEIRQQLMALSVTGKTDSLGHLPAHNI